jgi:hypothetical protein
LNDAEYLYFEEFTKYEDPYDINFDSAKEDDDWFDDVALLS